jgi:hypothetical protein
MNGGENTRDLKCLQVDLKFNKVLRGRQERICSRSSFGSRLQIFGSISGEAGLGFAFAVPVMGWNWSLLLCPPTSGEFFFIVNPEPESRRQTGLIVMPALSTC